MRVYELAQDLEYESAAVLTVLRDEGIFVRSASSVITPEAERVVRARLAGGSEVQPVPYRPRQTEDHWRLRSPAASRGAAPARKRVRVYALAKEFGLESKDLLLELRAMGEFVRSASSTLPEPVVTRLREQHGVKDVPDPQTNTGAPAVQASTATSRSVLPPRDPQEAWRTGAIAPPQHESVIQNIERLKRRFPIFSEHLAAFRKLGSQVVHSANCQQDRFRDCSFARVRFSGALEGAFGFNREVLIFYSPHEDLHSRTFDAAFREARKSSATPDIIFIWSPDVRLEAKLRDWSRPAELAIPLLLDPYDPMSLVKLLRAYVYGRDLFYMTVPVYGSNFFGRTTLLQSLRDDALNQRVVGIFGLRKSGKTSILRQLMLDLSDDGVISILMDLESLPSPPEDPTDDFLSEMRSILIDALKTRGVRSTEISQLDATPTILQFKNALSKLCRRLHKDGIKLLFLLDEIEYLTPADRIDIEEGDLPRVAQLFAALRSVVQESENFNFILSGLTSHILECGRLYGRPNPLFSWAKAVYVGPLSRAEADELATTVGRRMGVRFTNEALAALHEATGGHAFLYRSYCSVVSQSLSDEDEHRRIDGPMVLGELNTWKTQVHGNIGEMYAHVERYYGVEATLLSFLLRDPETFAEIAPSESVGVQRLTKLGLISYTDGQYHPSVILELL